MEKLFNECIQQVRDIYERFDASHDFDHIMRVLKNAEDIAATLPESDLPIIRLAALLHDIDDPKYAELSNLSAEDVMQRAGMGEETIVRVLTIINSVSFNGGNEKAITSIEGAVVRDADRLDAIGAIGIARTFAFGGARGRKLYDTQEISRSEMTEEEYRAKETASVTHFYEKLLLLKELMVTEEGKRLAEQRHAFMVAFLKQLEEETGNSFQPINL